MYIYIYQSKRNPSGVKIKIIFNFSTLLQYKTLNKQLHDVSVPRLPIHDAARLINKKYSI